MLFLHRSNHVVAFSQVNPFLSYEKQIKSIFDIHIRAVPNDEVSTTSLRDADLVCLQTDFDLTETEAERLFTQIRERNPKAKIVYLDCFAPLDLRLANILDPHIDLYVKRQVFSDLADYQRPTIGDTNLMDYYCRKYQLEEPQQFFPVPERFFQKLILGPGLFTGHYLFNRFQQDDFPDHPKTIDMHARLSAKGTPWYSAMRREAIAACENLRGFELRMGGGVDRNEYLAELARSKICFSPFGYGEVCWRDFEAIQAGALLLKPDMSHLRTDPNIYRDQETYVSVDWDYKDLAEKVDFYSRNAEERNRIVDNARQLMRDYMKNFQFLKQMEPVFKLAHGEPAPAISTAVVSAKKAPEAINT